MYWSGYDTAILLAGILTLALTIVPGTALTSQTRLAIGGVGAALVILSIITGNLQSVLYPSAVWIAPILAVVAGVALVVRRQTERAQPEQTHANLPPTAARVAVDPDLAAARDPHTPLAVLADLAYDRPELRTAIAENPSTYAGLLQWLAQLDAPDVAAALARRSDEN